MKRGIFLIVCALVVLGCQETKKDTVTVEGEFIYLGDAAVLKGDTFIYGVKIDKKTEDLAQTVKPLQRDEFDMVPVIIEGIINKKEEGAEGWEEILTIVKVLEVKAPKGKAPIRIESDQTKIKVDSLKRFKNSK